MAAKARRKSAGGRPSRERAQKIRDDILDIATRLFLEHGYGATSIEAVAQAARMSKRTFYARFDDKEALFAGVVERLVGRLRPKDPAPFFSGGSLEDILNRLARLILHAALMPDAVALHRLILAEAGRFPELARIADSQGGRHDAIEHIAALLDAHAVRPDRAASRIAAEQFLQLVVTTPQRRAMGLGGTPMNETEAAHWARDAVALFLHGYPANPR
ncbi:MAG: TetR/AcrR family transcriptional regulator [Alphaproteobacteria bacterium]